MEARDSKAAAAALVNAGYQADISGGGQLVLTERRAIEAPDQVAIALVNAGTPPTKLAVMQDDLESYFLQRVSGKT